MPDAFAIGILACILFGLFVAAFSSAGDDAKNIRRDRGHFNDWRGLDDDPPGFSWRDEN